MIDEGFNACDADNKNNVKELLEYMRSYYDWILIVSHDEFIKSFYDMDIRIRTSANGSFISNVENHNPQNYDELILIDTTNIDTIEKNTIDENIINDTNNTTNKVRKKKEKKKKTTYVKVVKTQN